MSIFMKNTDLRHFTAEFSIFLIRKRFTLQQLSMLVVSSILSNTPISSQFIFTSFFIYETEEI